MEFQNCLKLHMGRKPGVRIVGEDQLSLSVFKKLGTADGGAVDDLDPYVRMILVKTAKIRDEKIAAQSIAGTDTKLSGKIPFSGKSGLPFIEHGKSRLHMLKKQFALRCEDDSFCASDEKRVAQLFFQIFDSLAYC